VRLPLGYDSRDLQLVVNPEEAKLVKEIFTQYLRLGSVFELKQYLDKKGVRSKARVRAAGQKHGGLPFARGALYHLLSNPIYIGKISYKKLVYPGRHEAILRQKLWEQVAAKLNANRQNRHARKGTTSPNMLAG
jgi:site-specific DNA recombinase